MHMYTCAYTDTCTRTRTRTYTYESLLGGGGLTMASPIRGKEDTPWRVECSETREERMKQSGEPAVTMKLKSAFVFPLTSSPVRSGGLHEPACVLCFREGWILQCPLVVNHLKVSLVPGGTLRRWVLSTSVALGTQ